MATKTARILSYLPGTFRVTPPHSPLRAVVDAFGTELLHAENSLAALMRAHWVDHADRTAALIDDLSRMGALYGLAPRTDQDVEQFREHLKRHVRMYLEGTVTVQGLLRVVAAALGVNIADSYQTLDTWWTRDGDTLTDFTPSGQDAAGLLLGKAAASVRGEPAQPARIEGDVSLGAGVDLSTNARLHLQVDGQPLTIVDLASGAPDPAAVSAEHIVDAINAALGIEAAALSGERLVLMSPTLGSASSLLVGEGADDAAIAVLGLLPHRYQGHAARAADFRGSIDLAAGLDLSTVRYLRLALDGNLVAEIDCAGADPGNTDLDEIRNAINIGMGINLASHDGHYLRLTSPNVGAASSIAFLQAAAQDAAVHLFGPHPSVVIGADPQPAEVTGTPDLSAGVDLSERFNLRLQVDGVGPLTINCAGADAANTQLPELVITINAALGADTASHNGRTLTIRSVTTGPAAVLNIMYPNEADASADLLGIRARDAVGESATRARIAGDIDLSAGVNLMARRFLQLSVDEAPFSRIDLRRGAADPELTTPEVLRGAINTSVGSTVASLVDGRLVLTSPFSGPSGSLQVVPLERERQRRFVTRARIVDEAAQAILGFSQAQAVGSSAMPARISGSRDLSRGVDLREARYLRIALDSEPGVDIDCAGPRPRTTTLQEVFAAINAAMGAGIAADNGRHLILTSPTAGGSSRIALQEPRAEDGLEKLLGTLPGTVRGSAATQVVFVGTVDLSAVVDLSSADAVKLAIDGGGPVEIALAGPDPTNTTLNQVVVAINLALGDVIASHDDAHLLLSSRLKGSDSRIEFLVPANPDATATLFGIDAPRTYQGQAASAARLEGEVDLSAGEDLRVGRFLRLGVDTASVQDIDCAAAAVDPSSTSLDEMTAAINDQLGLPVASHDGSRLQLTSPSSGLGSRLVTAVRTGGDARALLLGEVEESAEGHEPGPAVITGELDLAAGVDLGGRGTLRLALNGGRAVDIEVTGADPRRTFGDEIVAAVNGTLPGVASLTPERRLALAAAGGDVSSRIDLLPLRYLETIEYLAEPEAATVEAVLHGQSLTIHHTGAADVNAQVRFDALHGASGPGLVNRVSGLQVRLLLPLQPGDSARVIREGEHGVRAEVEDSNGDVRSVPPERLLIGPLLPHLHVPASDAWRLAPGEGGVRALILNNPSAPDLVIVRVREPSDPAAVTEIAVTEADLSAADEAPPLLPGQMLSLAGRLQREAGGYLLRDHSGALLARLAGVGESDRARLRGAAVRVTGTLLPGVTDTLQVDRMTRLFDVAVTQQRPDEPPSEERFSLVTIGESVESPDSLHRRINVGPSRSLLVRASSMPKAQVLRLPRGRSQWTYRECDGDRFDHAWFDHAEFAGGLCHEPGLFDVSRFANAPPEQFAPVFASEKQAAGGGYPAAVELSWFGHRPGTLQVNLPADLPPAFGARFNVDRFALPDDAPESFAEVVTEPSDDPDFLTTRVNDPDTGSALIQASLVPSVPLGFAAVQMPFRRPRSLTRGDTTRPARVYLAEEGVQGFIELSASAPGEWGNQVSVSACDTSPGRFDLQLSYPGARFENARQATLGAALSAFTQDFLEPGTVGVLQGKAAGVRVEVSRDRADYEC